MYLTNGFFSQNYEKRNKGILNAKEWEHLRDGFDFSEIPTYLMFDANEKLRHKLSGYQGNEEMQKMVENLL